MASKVSIQPKSLQEFLGAIGQFAAGMKITMRDAILEQAALACQDAANFTPPLVKGGGRGLSGPAKTAGEGAVSGDISKIFVAANDRSSKSAPGMLVNQIAFAAKSNDFGLFNRIVSGDKIGGMLGSRSILTKIAQDTDRERAFQKAKNFLNRANPVKSDYGTQGYVTNLKSVHDQVKARFGGRIKKGQKAVAAKMLIENKDTLKEYVLKRQQAVGASKSGWYKALISLPRATDNNGQQGEPGAELRKATWITAHSNVAGYNTSNFTDSSCAVTIVNTLGNVNGIADQADTLGLVYGNRVKQMPSQVRYRMQKRVDKFNRK